MKKYCIDQSVPDESSLRKNYIAIFYNEVMNEIESDRADNATWKSADETTDGCDLCVAHIIRWEMNIGTSHLHIIGLEILTIPLL